MTDHAEQRAVTLAAFREIAARVFAEQPHVRSLLVAFAQYRDEDYQHPEDAIHVRVVASIRDVPVWPHTCSWYEGSAGGEFCDHCGDVASPDAEYPAWESFTRQHRGDYDDFIEIFQPYAIARRGPGGAVVEIVGRLQHAPAPYTEPPGKEPFRTPRAKELFDEIVADPDDDGPRAVLADHLLESRRGDSRGELIALSLAAQLDVAAAERRDELIARHGRSWMAPLERVIPRGGGRYARGFLAGADVHADRAGIAAVAGARAWGTVETIRFLPGSLDFVDEAMTALRDVGILRRRSLEAIADAGRPWRIERMHAMFEEAQTARWSSYGPSLELLSRIETLPRLRALTLGFDAPDKPWLIEEAVPRLPAAPWWKHLESLTIVVPVPQQLANWREHQRRLGIARLTIAHAGPHGAPAGWQFAFGASGALEISSADFHGRATLANLAALVAGLPSNLQLHLQSSPFRVFAKDDAVALSELTGRLFTFR